MVEKTFYSIFKQGSRTYFYSSLFFPAEVKADVFRLYSFVRQADNFIDRQPQQKAEFFKFKLAYQLARQGKPAQDQVINSFVALSNQRRFEPAWVDAFLYSMELDTFKSSYANFNELEEYIYGSAEVIGLMMAKIMGLKPEADDSARLLGKAMQYINFIRDIKEDLSLGRTYLPLSELQRFGFAYLGQSAAKQRPAAFSALIREQLLKYEEWDKKAAVGFADIPKRYLIPIKTAADMYRWTANQIKQNPFIIFEKKVKPSVARIIGQALLNLITVGK
jgi:phytoene synthase